MIDSHCHLDFKEFDRDREETIKRFFEAGGEKLINVGCDLASSERSVELAEKCNNIFASVGVHPHDADELAFCFDQKLIPQNYAEYTQNNAEKINRETLKKLEELVVKEKVIAVGEIGLDFFRNLSPREIQIEAFKTQLELANKHKKPLIIHCRDAYVDLLEILKSYKTKKWSGTIHCFLGSWLIAEELLKMGFYLGFTGAITYAKKPKITNTNMIDSDLVELFVATSGERSRTSEVEPEIFKVIKNTPLDRILIETDCPYLAPVPHRGERNEPVFVKHVAEKIAELKGAGVEEIEKVTSKNARKLFGI